MDRHEVIVSRGDGERAQKLGAYFRNFLGNWVSQLMVGMLTGYSEKVMRELVLALLEHAAAVLIATSDAARDEPDEQTAERSQRAAREVFAVLEREVLS